MLAGVTPQVKSWPALTLEKRSRPPIAAVPLTPSEVAVIVTSPGPTPRATPVPLTLTTRLFELCQVTTRPLSVVPPASLTVAVSWSDSPRPTVPVAGLTVTLATGATTTVTVAVALFPSDVPVIVTVPGETPRTTPRDDTTAVAGAELDHENTRPGSGALPASNAVPVRVTVAPTLTVEDGGATMTDATGVVLTVSVTEPLFPSDVAVICAVPAATPVTTPWASTVATAGSPLAYVMTRLVSTLPLASLGTAVSGAWAPTVTTGPGGSSVTLATGTRFGGPSGSAVQAHSVSAASSGARMSRI